MAEPSTTVEPLDGGVPRAPHLRAARVARRIAGGFAVALLLLVLLLRVGYAESGDGAPPSAAPGRLVLPTPTPAATESAPVPPSGEISGTAAVTTSAALTLSSAVEPQAIYIVQSGDTLFGIAQQYGITFDDIVIANNLPDPDVLEVGQQLLIPTAETAALLQLTGSLTAPVPVSSTLVISAMTESGRSAGRTSPYYRTTWLTYYGRPGIPVMGIVGEHDIITLTKLLQEKAKLYDAANGSNLAVQPAYHLVHGMATITPTDNGSHLVYLDDDVVMKYIDAGLKDGIDVILDIQLGALSVTEAISPALKFLEYPNVHLAIDPEFAMSTVGQTVPGNPIGYVTGQQINEAMDYVEEYMVKHNIEGRRIFLVHQFFEEMIINKWAIDWNNPRLELTFAADGWGDPWGKITKYNGFFDERDDVNFTAFKLFYRWDVPVLTERQVMGVDKYSSDLFMQVTPNMVIYQ